MKRLPFIHVFSVLLTVLFLAGQAAASAHIVVHHHHDGHHSHDQHDHDHHDGVTCTITVLGEDSFILPVPGETDTAPVEEGPVLAERPVRAIAFSTDHPNRAPPPRAPPH